MLLTRGFIGDINLKKNKKNGINKETKTKRTQKNGGYE